MSHWKTTQPIRAIERSEPELVAGGVGETLFAIGQQSIDFGLPWIIKPCIGPMTVRAQHGRMPAGLGRQRSIQCSGDE